MLSKITYRYSKLNYCNEFASFIFHIGNEKLTVSLSMQANCCEYFGIDLQKNDKTIEVPLLHCDYADNEFGADEYDVPLSLRNSEVESISFVLRLELNDTNKRSDVMLTNIYSDVNVTIRDEPNFVAIEKEHGIEQSFTTKHGYVCNVQMRNGDKYSVVIYNHHNGYYPHDLSVEYGKTSIKFAI